jgi:hypothetical protein
VFLHQLVEPFAFAAQHNHGRRYKIDLIVLLIPALIETVDPEASVLKVFQGFRDVADPDYRQIFKGSRGRFCYSVRQAGGAAFRNHHGVCSRRMSGSDDRAEIVRVFHAIQHHDHFCAGDNVFFTRVLRSRAECDDALMGFVATGAFQGVACLKPNSYTILAAKVDDFLQTWSAGALGDEHAVKGAFGFERFTDRIHSDENSHLMMVAASAISGKEPLILTTSTWSNARGRTTVQKGARAVGSISGFDISATTLVTFSSHQSSSA